MIYWTITTTATHSQFHGCGTSVVERAPCDLMFSCWWLEILHGFWTRGPAFSSCTLYHKLCPQSCCHKTMVAILRKMDTCEHKVWLENSTYMPGKTSPFLPVVATPFQSAQPGWWSAGCSSALTPLLSQVPSYIAQLHLQAWTLISFSDSHIN